MAKPYQPWPVADGAPVRGRRVAADDERDRLLHRARVGVDAGEVDEAAVVLGVLVVPERVHGVDELVGDRAAVLEVGADRPELRLEVADADAEREAAAADSTSRLAICLARTTGLRCGTITIPVARRTVDVTAAAYVSPMNGSSAGSCGAIGDGGTCGSGRITCSPAHSDSNPASSAARAARGERRRAGLARPC